MDVHCYTSQTSKSNEWITLFLDGHSSHNTMELILSAEAHKTLVASYPPHGSHLLQSEHLVNISLMHSHSSPWLVPDIVGHGTLKHEASKDHVEAVFQGKKIMKGNILCFIEVPWRKAFSTQNVQKSYAAVGVWPFDLSKIKPAAVEPSKATKVDGRFPVPVESPVRVIEAGLSKELAAMNPPHPPILTLPTILPSPTSSTPVNASTDSLTQTATGYHVTLTMMAGTHAGFIFSANPLSPSKHFTL